MITFLKLFFMHSDHNFFYGHKFFIFGKLFFIFQKWTKKMSKNENPKKLCPKNSKQAFTYVVLLFITFFKEYMKFIFTM